jgi:hypothetical protein
MTLVSTFGSAIAFYAVRQTKVESFESKFSTTLVPMQPNSARGNATFPTRLSSKPLDFSCTELDFSAMETGAPMTFQHSRTFPLDHNYLQERVLCCLSSHPAAWTQPAASCIPDTLNEMIF